MQYDSRFDIIEETQIQDRSKLGLEYKTKLNYLMRKTPSYIKHFEQIIINDLRDIKISQVGLTYNLIKDHKQLFKDLVQKFDSFDSFEKLDDYVHLIINDSKKINFVKKFVSSKYFFLVNSDTIELFDRIKEEVSDFDKIHELLIKKIASFKSSLEFNNNVQTVLNQISNKFGNKAIKQKCIESGANIIQESDTYLIVETPNYSCLRLIGSPNWCIVRSQSTFNNYLNDEKNNSTNLQYVIFDLSKSPIDPNHMVGVTVDWKSGIRAAHNYSDLNVRNEIQEHFSYKYLAPISEDRLVKSLNFYDPEVIVYYNLYNKLEELIKNKHRFDDNTIYKICNLFLVKRNIEMLSLIGNQYNCNLPILSYSINTNDTELFELTLSFPYYQNFSIDSNDMLNLVNTGQFDKIERILVHINNINSNLLRNTFVSDEDKISKYYSLVSVKYDVYNNLEVFNLILHKEHKSLYDLFSNCPVDIYSIVSTIRNNDTDMFFKLINRFDGDFEEEGNLLLREICRKSYIDSNMFQIVYSNVRVDYLLKDDIINQIITFENLSNLLFLKEYPEFEWLESDSILKIVETGNVNFIEQAFYMFNVYIDKYHIHFKNICYSLKHYDIKYPYLFDHINETDYNEFIGTILQ